MWFASTAKKMAELRENARCIFWSGALAFHGPKIIFLHDKHEEMLVERSSFILCTFLYPRCYGRLKYGKIQCTNGIENIAYFTRMVTNERKFSWRWNTVETYSKGWKTTHEKTNPDKFSLSWTSVVKMLWSPIEIMQIRYVLAYFERNRPNDF